MKTPWCCLCLALLAGCSSSSATVTEEVTTQKRLIHPDWALVDSSSATNSDKPQIHPIPDEPEESPDVVTQQVMTKPFPADDLR